MEEITPLEESANMEDVLQEILDLIYYKVLEVEGATNRPEAIVAFKKVHKDLGMREISDEEANVYVDVMEKYIAEIGNPHFVEIMNKKNSQSSENGDANRK